MKIQHILEYEEQEENTLNQTGPYSFEVYLKPNQKLGLKNFVTGQMKINTLYTRHGDILKFIYDFDHNVLTYEVLHINPNHGRGLLEDGEFKLQNEEDISLLKRDLSAKLKLFDGILNPSDFSKVKYIYNNILKNID